MQNRHDKSIVPSRSLWRKNNRVRSRFVETKTGFTMVEVGSLNASGTTGRVRNLRVQSLARTKDGVALFEMSLLFSPLLLATCFSSFREEKSNERVEKKVNKWIKRKENYSVCWRRILSFGKVDRSTESTDITKDVSSNTILLLTIFSIVSSSNRGSIRR